MKSIIRNGTALAMAIGLATPALPAAAQQAPAPATLTAHAVKGGAYRMEGGRSNTGFVVGPTGVTVIDTEMTPDTAAKALAAIKGVTPKPVSAIVITHADPDHVGGLGFYPAVPVYMQENARDEVVASAADPNAPPMYKAMYAALLARLPGDTVGNTTNVTLGGTPVQLMYFGPGHTSGDLVVYLPQQKVVYGGDFLVNTSRFPIVHLDGSTLGWISAMKAMLALNADVYVPGHGAIETKAQLAARVKDAETRRSAIKAMVAQGKTLAEIEQALPDPTDNPMFLTFTQTVYAELTKGYPAPLPPWANVIRR